MLDKVAGFRDSQFMAKERAARAKNTRGNLASRRLEQNPAKSPNPNSQAIQFSDSVLCAMISCATLAAYFPALRGAYSGTIAVT